MISKTNKVLQIIRDIIIILPSAVLTIPAYQQAKQGVLSELQIGLLIVLSVLILLSLINLALIIIKTESRAYYYFNAIFQMIPAFGIAGVGQFVTPPLGIMGSTIMILNIIILITLRKKKNA